MPTYLFPFASGLSRQDLGRLLDGSQVGTCFLLPPGERVVRREVAAIDPSAPTPSPLISFGTSAADSCRFADVAEARLDPILAAEEAPSVFAFAGDSTITSGSEPRYPDNLARSIGGETPSSDSAGTALHRVEQPRSTPPIDATGQRGREVVGHACPHGRRQESVNC